MQNKDTPRRPFKHLSKEQLFGKWLDHEKKVEEKAREEKEQRLSFKYPSYTRRALEGLTLYLLAWSLIIYINYLMGAFNE